MTFRPFLISLVASLTAYAAAAAQGPATSDDGSSFDEQSQVIEGFQAYGGTWSVKDGELRVAAEPGGPKLISREPPFGAGAVGVEMFLSDRAGGKAGLVVKVSQPAVGADAFDGYEIAVDAKRQELRLGRHQHNFELLRDRACAVPVGRWFPLVVRMTETTLEIEVDHRPALQYDDKTHPLRRGSVGFRVWGQDAQYRKFWIGAGNAARQIDFAAPKEKTPRAWPETLRGERLPPVAFITRQELSRPPAAGQDLWAAQPRGPGCSIRIIDPSRPDSAATTIFRDPDGCIYDMNVSCDARTLLFSYRRRSDRQWHIWRIGVDGSGLRQLTDGPFYDVSPCQLPGGDVVFVSTRRFGYTLCQPGPSSNLHCMSADGGNIRCVSMNTLSDFSPQMLPDGRVLFTRWEYIDRDLTFRQSLWTQYPDGTFYQLYFGNTIRDVGTFWQARPLPGRNDRVVATFAPHHGYPHGAIGLIDRAAGPEGPKGVGFTYITREFPHIGDSQNEWSYRDPFPLDDRTFLCSYGGGGVNRFRIYLLDSSGRKRLLYEDSQAGCYFPLALRAVDVPPRIPPRAESFLPDAAGEMPRGECMLVDVYRGVEPAIQRGRIKYLRIMEQVRKTADLSGRAFDQSPVMSYGTYYAKRCWGEVPVEEDGSARFFVPALREVYFQVLDSQRRELQRMTSAVQVMPGERVGCIGCHESRQSAPPSGAAMPAAARRPPTLPVPPVACPDGIVDFPNVVQPVLDKYCAHCHSGPSPAGGYNLSGDKTRYFNMAYDNLLGRSRSYRQHDMETGEMLPSERSKGKPLVHFYWLLRTPSAVNQPFWTGCYASRLPDYLEAKHCEQEMPQADRQSVYLWIDANVPYYGTYAHGRPLSPGKRDLWTDPATGKLAPWFERDFLGVYDRRCAECHGRIEGTTDWEGRFAWIDLTRPEHSPALSAHLSKQAGGRGIATPLQGKTPPRFSDTADPDYAAMLRAIRTGQAMAVQTPEADMRGFQGQTNNP